MERKIDSGTSTRLEVVDALRGFAVLAILLVHQVEHYIFSVYPTDSPVWLQAVDDTMMKVVFALFAGKAYAIFSLLFGFTFYMQYAREERNGRDFGYRFLWRLLLLAGFATLNAAFFPGGDVLLLYAVMGVVLFVARRWSDKVVLCLSVLFLLQPVEWFHYAMGLVVPGYALPDWGVGAMYDKVGEVVKSGSLLDFVVCNVTLGQKASLFWAVGGGRMVQTAGLFLAGLYIGRKRLFAPGEKNDRLWSVVLAVSAILYVPLFTVHGVLASGDSLAGQTLGTVFDMWHKLAFTLVLVASFVQLYQFGRVRDVASRLCPYGRMSLTNYVSQSLVGALVFFPLGLYLAPHCGAALSLLIGFGVFALQLYFCKWWLKTHKQGPLEALWYRLTWMGR